MKRFYSSDAAFRWLRDVKFSGAACVLVQGRAVEFRRDYRGLIYEVPR